MLFLVSFVSYCLACVLLGHAAPIEIITVDMTYDFHERDMPVWPGVKTFDKTVVANGSFPGIEWLQSEEFEMATHVGTHMDAPSHFTLGGLTIDQIPASRLIAPAAVINIKHKAVTDPNAEVSVEDLERWEKTTGQTLNGTIVLVNSGWGKKWHDRKEFLGRGEDEPGKLPFPNPGKQNFPGVSPEAAQWLVDNREVNGVGVDTVSLDKGSTITGRTHVILLGSGMFGLENVANLDQIPISGATLYVAPMKIEGASGAPARIIATFPKVIYDERDGFCSE